MKHIHIVGICGTFMGGIAAIAKEAGFRVTGCDAHVYPPMSTQLDALGIEVIEGFDPDQIKLNPDVYVIGNVVKRGNPLMEAILNQNLAYISGPQWLAEQVLHKHWVLAVAGTHGKTTTASMLAWVLEYAGLAPGFLIGGVPENFGVSARLPQTPAQDPHSISPFFVIEADEYDTAFFDKRSKFVHYHPRTAILNNLEYDHADIFPNLAAIQTQFHHLVRTIPGDGLIVSNAQAPALDEALAMGAWTPVAQFATESGWHTDHIDHASGHFDVCSPDGKQGRITWALMGEHNRQNALACIAAARHIGVTPEVSCEALSQFNSVKRRMEVKGTVNNVVVYDDFAHHPTAINLTMDGLRAKV
ncbi:MAG: UDP-N-acetylmuramate:L-alanyl-gamma-D-glutamyl-meso-diaminopimelate ligase, partial [Neisseriaceae bacterium]|nr:UDP-N-acetylmuramate:L-alanyl-gamma-D-glutamyl-meso-diaminopimelate ligase [Neisseriaceae bacterium]